MEAKAQLAERSAYMFQIKYIQQCVYGVLFCFCSALHAALAFITLASLEGEAIPRGPANFPGGSRRRLDGRALARMGLKPW